jgi:nicotinamide phosphoribosyltransferase
MYIPNTQITRTDSYKISHWKQYPPGTTEVTSYIESRGGPFDEIVFMGIAAYIHNHLKDFVFKDDIKRAKEFFQLHGLEINEDGWNRLATRYGWDHRLPIEIQALPEGTVVSPRIPLVQIRNTDPEFFWLTSYLETSLLRAIWYPTTVATISRECKKIIYRYLQKSADDPDSEIMFKLHDFGARGASSGETAALGGLAHLVNFMGTDTVEALVLARNIYNEKMAGFSIPASEHSTITSWGGPDKEGDAFKNMLDQFGQPGKMLACVSDSYNIYRACQSIWGGRLKDQVQRLGDHGGCLVVRPDSGEPKVVVRDVITMLMDAFGFKRNSKGYSVLPPYVRVIQGDGVNLESIKEILDELDSYKISGSNVAFGMGGALLQKCDRDTLKFAMKCNEIVVNGEMRDVYKSPSGDSSKASKAGRQAVVYKDFEWKSIKESQLERPSFNLLSTVYKNGAISLDTSEGSFAKIRERAKI